MIAWIDTETIGLLDQLCPEGLLEIAVVVTDDDLNVLGQFERTFHFVLPEHLRDVALRGQPRMVHQTQTSPLVPGEYVFDMHSKNNLWVECDASEYTHSFIDQALVDWMMYLLGAEKGTVVAGGANIASFDRRWLEVALPRFNDFLHYRNVDMSTLKTMVRMWSGGDIGNPPAGRGLHRAMPDILDTIDLARFYRDHFFKQRSIK